MALEGFLFFFFFFFFSQFTSLNPYSRVRSLVHGWFVRSLVHGWFVRSLVHGWFGPAQYLKVPINTSTVCWHSLSYLNTSLCVSVMFCSFIPPFCVCF